MAERDLSRALRELRAPGENEAEERSLAVIRAAYADREPAAASGGARRVALAVAAGVAALAIGLSPAGAKVADLVSDVISPEPGAEDAKPQLRSLPAAGEILVESAQGPWVVRADGSKRLLGDYDQATWSPHGLYIAVTDGHEVIAVDPAGNVRWTITAPGVARDPRWAPSGFRIAYRSGGDLWVVAGDGTGSRRVARDVAPVAPAWRPIGDSKLAQAPGQPQSNVVTYVTADHEIRTIDVDSGARLESTAGDLERLSTPPAGGPGHRSLSPDGSRLATIEVVHGHQQLVVSTDEGTEAPLFSARGRLTGPTWSPDGRWLLIGWPAADQWLFIDTAHPRRVIAFDDISEQFEPGGAGAAPFPSVSGWILPER